MHGPINIRYRTVFWLIELHIRRGRKVQAQVHAVNYNSGTANCQYSLFSKENPIIRIFCLSGWLAVPINHDEWSSTAFLMTLAATYDIFS